MLAPNFTARIVYIMISSVCQKAMWNEEQTQSATLRKHHLAYGRHLEHGTYTRLKQELELMGFRCRSWAVRVDFKRTVWLFSQVISNWFLTYESHG